jgi:acyl-CoA synthetase (AMP-forming)/AMP-acid ligase II
VCVGAPIRGIDVRIIAITEEPLAAFEGATLLPPGEIGEIVVSGPVVTGSYVADPFATSQAKLTDAGGRLWHRMGDVGYFDERGRLWYCGRKSHRVVTPRDTLFTECVEAVFNQHPDIRRTALVGIGKRGEQRPVLMVQLRSPQQAPATVEPGLRAIAAANPGLAEIDRFLFCHEFPVDVRHNAKIFREKLAVEAEQRLRKGEGGRT